MLNIYHSENGFCVLYSLLGKMHKVVLCQEHRSPTQLGALEVRFPSICSTKVEVFLLQLWAKELHFRLRHLVAKHQSWVQMHLTAWIEISQFLKQMFPLQSHSANTTALSTSQGHVLLFECRWPWHLSAEIPTAVFKPLKSGLCFCWR